MITYNSYPYIPEVVDGTTAGLDDGNLDGNFVGL